MATKMKKIEDMSEDELMQKSGVAYNKAMPSPEPGEKSPRYKDNFPSQAAAIRKGFADNEAREKANTKERADMGKAFKENMEEGRSDAMGNMYKKGGSVSSSASKRADGCCSKGKTRGKMM